MSKSYAAELLRVFHCLFEDVKYAYPAMEAELVKDQESLHKFVESRGLSVFLKDLPALGKHLDRCLANGEYLPSGLPLSKRVSTRVVIPKFLRGLYLLVFDERGQLKGAPDVQAILFLRQVYYLAKKTELDCPLVKKYAEVRAFMQVDRFLPKPSGFWEDDYVSVKDVECLQTFASTPRYSYGNACFRSLFTGDTDPVDAIPFDSGTHQRLLNTLDFVSGVLCSTLGSYDPDEWRFRHGPGAVSDAKRYTSKYNWTVWPDRLEREFPISDYGYHNYGAWASMCSRVQAGGDPMSKLVPVPKDPDRPRLIAAEPTAHQWCQQNVRHYFYARVAHTWINKFILFEDQTRNRVLARRGSIDGSLATIDLSSASDLISCLAVGCMFRSSAQLLLALQATRTRVLYQDVHPGLPSEVRLRKFSTMGNACTFPVESLLFLTVVVASVLTQRRLPLTKESILSLAGEVAVYGDDLIVPADSRELVIWCLGVLDFKVNASKSYWTGRFRESCGLDSFDGVDVTPVYWKAPYSSDPESYVRTLDVCNNFYKKFYVNIAGHLRSTVKKWRPPLLPFDSGALGLVTRNMSESTLPYKSRWNARLQRDEFLIPVLISTAKRKRHQGDACLLQYFTEDPPPLVQWEAGYDTRPKLRVQLRWVPLFDLTSSAQVE